MANVLRRSREPLLSALAVAVAGQVLFTTCGSHLPDRSDFYGAPFAVGQSAGWNIIFTAGMGSFWLPLWVLNVVVTGAVLLVAAFALRGQVVPGVIAAGLAVISAYMIYFIAAQLQLASSDYNTNQMVIWIWMLLVVTTVWAINRLRRAKVDRGRRTI